MSARFVAMMAVSDNAADDEVMLGELRKLALSEWADQLARAGGSPVGQPTVRRELNAGYGLVVRNADGSDLLDAAGEPVVDRVKLYLVVTGWAESPS